VELLPGLVEIEERLQAKRGLTRPELAVLLAYTKNSITESLALSEAATGGEFDELLLDYFPAKVREQHEDLVRVHPLRKELIATLLANEVVNRGGISMVYRLAEETSATVPDVALAHLAAWKIFELEDLWLSVRLLDAKIDANTHTAAELEIMKLGERATRWLLRNESQPLDLTAVVDRYQSPVHALLERATEGERPARIKARVASFVDGALDPQLAARIAWLGRGYGFLDLATVATQSGRALNDVSTVHALIEEELDLTQLREWVVALPRDDHWHTMARGALRDQYFSEHAELTAAVLHAGSPSETPEAQVQAWLSVNEVAVQRYRRTFEDIGASVDLGLAQVSVAIRALTQLQRSR